MKQEVVAIYARISKSDKKSFETNQSIVNQIQLIKEYIRKDACLSKMRIQIFQDEGYSGTNMERPAVKKLLAGIYLGRIHALVVKDFSRLSRNHIQLSEFRENTFLRYGVKFISIGDYYDSRDREAVELYAGFRSIFYEYYCRDVSRKVKKALEAKKENGEYAVAKAPYGYRKDSYGRFEIIPEEGEYVKKIFSLAKEGWNTAQIAEFLNQNNARTRGDDNCTSKAVWEPSQIWRILNNPVYMGQQVWHKYENHYQNGFFRQNVNREDWKSQRGDHSPLVSEEDFIQIQNMQRRTAGYGVKKGRRHVFHGITKCGICQKALCRHRQNPELLCCKEVHGKDQPGICWKILWKICLEQWNRLDQSARDDLEHMSEWEIELFLKQYVKRIEIGPENVVQIQWKVKRC